MTEMAYRTTGACHSPSTSLPLSLFRSLTLSLARSPPLSPSHTHTNSHTQVPNAPSLKCSESRKCAFQQWSRVRKSTVRTRVGSSFQVRDGWPNITEIAYKTTGACHSPSISLVLSLSLSFSPLARSLPLSPSHTHTHSGVQWTILKMAQVQEMRLPARVKIKKRSTVRTRVGRSF